MMRKNYARSLLACSAAIFVITACAHSGRANPQGWNADDQHRWYRGSQGSRLMPRDWLFALEESGSIKPFLRPENVARFGYLASPPSDPSTLPIGFALDRTDDRNLGITSMHWWNDQKSGEPWVGMNCAACHTNEIEYQGKTIRIDGAPTLADFQTFLNELDATLAATAADPQKFERFARAVLGPRQSSPDAAAMPDRYSAANAAMLKAALMRLTAQEQSLRALNAPEPSYGNGRLDAVGHILNRVAYDAGATDQFGGPSDAPVSYPFLWNINQHDVVQWNGIAPNKGAKLPSGEVFDIGALVRNTSEVIGVFADVTVVPNAPISGFHSSINVPNLDAMEVLTGKLMAPPWPAEMSKYLDAELAKTGGRLFVEHHCNDCHTVMPRTDLTTPIKAAMTPIWGPGGVGTDPWMACNVFTYQAMSGQLFNTKKGYEFGTDRFRKQDFTKDMLVATSIGSLFGQKAEITSAAARAAFGLPREITVAPVSALLPGQQPKSDRLRDCRANQTDKLMRYKGRPLNGIWATAPYLHNGSVRTLYQLLLPPAERETEFWVGSREFDPKDVGFVNQQGTRGTLFQVNRNGIPISGNSNAGHDYDNATLTNAQRYALIEYMKSL